MEWDDISSRYISLLRAANTHFLFLHKIIFISLDPADLNHLLLKNIDAQLYPLTKKLQKSLIENRRAIFTFVYHKKVPSHNNASEIAIRNFKVKMKVSGLFKSAQHYCVIIRSLIDTLIKNEKPIFDSLFRLETNQPVTLGLSL